MSVTRLSRSLMTGRITETSTRVLYCRLLCAPRFSARDRLGRPEPSLPAAGSTTKAPHSHMPDPEGDQRERGHNQNPGQLVGAAREAQCHQDEQEGKGVNVVAGSE